MNIADVVKATLDKPRIDGEINVVTAVETIMREAEYPLVDAWLAENDIQEIANVNSDLQRFLINRNFRMKLGMAGVNTSIERFALEASVGMDDYLENLRKYVVPALIIIETASGTERYRSPVVLS